MQHGYEMCIVGMKGKIRRDLLSLNKYSDVILDLRTRQNQKTNKIYWLIESFYSKSKLNIFFNNLYDDLKKLMNDLTR